MIRRRRFLVLLFLGALLAVLVWVVVQSRVLTVRGEEVVLEGDGVRLAATLALPRFAKPPYPAAVIVHGSGRVTRRDLRSWAGRLASRGMAVLIYDKRGVGESTGNYRNWNGLTCAPLLTELARDAIVGVDYLRSREDIDAGRIGLVGGSQAGWIMAMAADWTRDVSFVVAVSGPTVSCTMIDAYQDFTGASAGLPRSVDPDSVARMLSAHAGPSGYDPRPALEGMRCPSLWIYGGRDVRVPAHYCASVLEGIVAAGNERITFRVYPDGDHDLRNADTGDPIDFWSDVLTWLRGRGILDP